MTVIPINDTSTNRKMRELSDNWILLGTEPKSSDGTLVIV